MQYAAHYLVCQCSIFAADIICTQSHDAQNNADAQNNFPYLHI